MSTNPKRTKSNRRFHRRGRAAVLGVSAAVLAVGLGGVGAMAALGVPLFAKPYVAPAGPTQLQWQLTNASTALTAALNDPRQGWSLDGERQAIISPALPASCLSGLGGPRGVITQRFVVDEAAVNVSLAAYSAGAGAGSYDAIIDKLSDCGGARIEDGQGLGVQSNTLRTEPGGRPTTTSMWRRGDVVAYVSVTDEQGGVLNGAAAAMDASLGSRLEGTCVNQNSAADDAVRSPWVNRDSFVGLLKKDLVTVDPAVEPSLPPQAATTTGVPIVATAIPATEIPLESVSRPRIPSYPVWPELPAEVSKPAMPTAPIKPANSTEIQISIKDDDGPGCGWSFTGTKAPTFDQDGADTRAANDRQAAQSQLVQAGEVWRGQVLDYWTQYANYTDGATRYQAYAAQVNSVRAAWDVIAGQWATYNAQLKNYNDSVAARDSFLRRQQQAQSSYNAAITACQAPARTETRTITPSPVTSTIRPTASPTGSASDDEDSEPTSTPSGAPSPSTTVITPSPTTTTITIEPPACPSAPAILSQSAPTVGERPTPPADPRPVNER